MSQEIQTFVDQFLQSLNDSSFVKLILSNNRGNIHGPVKITARVIETKKGRVVSVQSRFDTNDRVKSFGYEEAAEFVHRSIMEGFRSGHLFTSNKEFQLTVGKRKCLLKEGKASHLAIPAQTHDRKKFAYVDQNAYFLKALGITSDTGQVIHKQQHKWKQINKFVEVLADLVERSDLKERTEIRSVDMGSGKGYLTFAVYEYLSQTLKKSVKMTGVELRPELVTLCNDVAETSGYSGLSFKQGSISSLEKMETDVLIALHACDTATDDAIFYGIESNAEIIIAAPCCHKEIKKQMHPLDMLSGILRHPVMMERTAEMVTDGIRSMVLEGQGYATKLFEFVSSEHTPKNNMLIAVRSDNKKDRRAQQELDDIFKLFSLRTQRLADLVQASGEPSKA